MAATCKRCHRPLRSAESVALGYGPRCAAIEAATEGLNDKQAAKVTEVISDHGVIPANRKGVYRVSSSDGTAAYLAHVNGNCTCAWGLRRTSAETKACYHVAAARLAARPSVRPRKPVAPSAPVSVPSGDVWDVIGRIGDAFMAAA